MTDHRSSDDMERQINALYEFIENYTRGGTLLDDAIQKLNNPVFGPKPPSQLVDEAVRRYKVNCGMIVEYERMDALETREAKEGRWYDGPDFESAHYWPSLRKVLEKSLGAAVESVDATSSRVVASLRPPGEEEFDVRGLVVGYVQSGKTTNFVSLIAKAADVGYRLIIVLAGMTDNLRVQTQERLEEQLLTKTDNWYKTTFVDNLETNTKESDFGNNQQSQKQNATTIFQNQNQRIIAVVKKHSTILKNLVEFIRSSRDLADKVPILIIDDEADQASINVSSQKKSEVSAINAQIRALLRNKKTAYVAYTATPFANILVNPNDSEDIYPKDFVHVLPKPDGYFGAEDIFGREPLFGEDLEDSDGLNMIRHIPDEEASFLKPPNKPEQTAAWSGQFPDSLLDAMKWFVLATAERRRRGQRDKHTSMLVHTAMKTIAHGEAEAFVVDELQKLKNDYASGKLTDSLSRTWYQETTDVPPERFGHHRATYDEIEPYISEVLADIKVVVDNGGAEKSKRLKYPDDDPQTVIAIGGNTLSRGLTLEGLVCSYFVRNTTAFDTLSQMGRWFGFRNGYQDLPRIWMTEELESWFRDLALVEADLRQDLSSYAIEGLSPLEFQARIRTHSSMAITSRSKQQSAIVANPGFSGQRVQTILFRHKDKAWLERNLEAAKAFVNRLSNSTARRFDKSSNGTVVFRGVSNDDVIQFLSDYQIYENSTLGENGGEKLIRYIERERQNSSIREWSVSFYGQVRSSGDSTDKLGLGRPLNPVNRSQLATSKPEVANIKALVGSMDRLNDIDLPKVEMDRLLDEVKNGTSYNDKLIKVRDRQIGPDVAHLVVYLIDRNSKTTQSEDGVKANGMVIQPRNRRKDLDAVEDVIGVGIFFPYSNSPEEDVEYIQAPPPDEETLQMIRDTEEFELANQ